VATWGPDLADASRPRVLPHQHPARQLELLGLGPRDVRAVVYTHLHHDHAGGGRVFPGAIHVVRRAEHRWATSPDGHAGKGYAPADFAADAINTVGCIDDDLPPGIATDTLAAVRSMHRLTALADATDALLVAGHDLGQFEALPKAPDPLRRPAVARAGRVREMLAFS
jgi:N-acyl homoserine lactone hydrolase